MLDIENSEQLERMAYFEDRMRSLENEVNEMRQTLNQLVGLLEAIKAEVMPTVELLMESPMVRMIAGGK